MSTEEKNFKFKKSLNNPEIQSTIEDSQVIKNNETIKKRLHAKEVLINKYHLSEMEAEEKLNEAERKALAKNSNGENFKGINHKNQRNIDKIQNLRKLELKKHNEKGMSVDDVIIPQHVLDREQKIKESKPIKDVIPEISTEQNSKKQVINVDNQKSENGNFQNNFNNNSNNYEINNQKVSADVLHNNGINVSEESLNNVSSQQNSVNHHTSEVIKKERTIPNNAQKHDVDAILSNIIQDYNQNISIEVQNVDLTFEVQNDKIDNLKEHFIRTLKRNKPKKTKFQALKDISFKIYKGEKVGIIGYNGAGKSTLLNVITGIYKPDSGCVKTEGRISPLLSLGAGFDYNYSGAKNIFLNGAVLGYDKKFLEEKYDEIVEFADLGEFINYPIKNYSSGMLAKLGFSIATIVEPNILIIDEILGVGDVNFKKKSNDKMKSLMDGQTTVILVSHSIPQIRQLCDKAIWIDNGCVREIGEVNTVCDNYLKDSEKASTSQLKNIQFR